ncbi:hypothetical protein ABIE26_001032 [Pedobacter africanus]|uniref:Uncharacterized protein n=1 Tax=Pedobacter africanus TaxID=151894 RepID=A0ACC6KTF6_9SPHI|nr:glycosyltransferase family 39 protein [Pedobacter africanus]MDR6782480.1 hypothetical protein [Pedobacter africanus]
MSKIIKKIDIAHFSYLQMNTLSYRKGAEQKNIWKTLLFLFIFLGTVLRLYHFFYNRSLWMDEVYLSASLIQFNFIDLIKDPLLYQQKAPIGFLFTVKIFVWLFGSNEFSLRCLPLISGLFSLLVFIPVSKYFLGFRASVIAIGILSFSPALIYHSVEIKQYSTELLSTLLCLYFLIRFDGATGLRSLFLWGMIGGLILWFSYSSVFILAGIGIARSLIYIINKKWKLLLLGILPYSIWLGSFALNYVLFTHKHAESEWIVYWFRAYGNFMPFPPKSITDLKWFALNLYRLMDYPLGLLWNFNFAFAKNSIAVILKMPILSIGLFIAGTYSFLKGNKILCFSLFFPVLLTLLASGMELYPLTERFWVFISPIFIIIIVKGLDLISSWFNAKFSFLMIAVLLLCGPVVQSAYYVWSPEKFYVHKKSFQREALMYVNQEYREGDVVYIYWNNLPGYRLYHQMHELKYTAVEGKDYRKESKNIEDYNRHLQSEIKRLGKHKRVWLIFNLQFLTDIGDNIDEPAWYYKSEKSPTENLLSEFSRLGNPVSKQKTADIGIYLININH